MCFVQLTGLMSASGSICKWYHGTDFAGTKVARVQKGQDDQILGFSIH